MAQGKFTDELDGDLAVIGSSRSEKRNAPHDQMLACLGAARMTNILLTGRLLDVGQTVTHNLAQGGDEAGRVIETAREPVLDRAAPGLVPDDAGRR